MILITSPLNLFSSKKFLKSINNYRTSDYHFNHFFSTCFRKFQKDKHLENSNRVYIVPLHVVKVAKNHTGGLNLDSNGTKHPENSPYTSSSGHFPINMTGNFSINAPKAGGSGGIYVYSYVPPHRPQRIFYPALASRHPKPHYVPRKITPPQPSIYHLLYTAYNGEGKNGGSGAGESGGGKSGGGSSGGDGGTEDLAGKPSTTENLVGADVNPTSVGTTHPTTGTSTPGMAETTPTATLWMNLTTTPPTTSTGSS